MTDRVTRPDPPPIDVPIPDPVALLFDLDGTLVDTVNVRVSAWLDAFAEVGITADVAELGALMGADGVRVAREVGERHGRPLSVEQAEEVDRRSGVLFSARNTTPRPLPGIRDLLQALQQARVAWAIATSSRPDQTGASIAALGLSAAPRLVDASHVTHAKPAPDLLLAGAEQLGVAARRCWYVGDATWDMLAARSAMMVAVGIPSGATRGAELLAAGARLVVTDAMALHALLAERGVLPVPA